MRATPEKVRSAIRRWLTYLTLFLAAIAMGVNLMTLVWAGLGGELSIRFALKVLTVFAAAGSGFHYYLVSLRVTAEQIQVSRIHRRYGAAASAIGVVLIAGGIVSTGTPAVERVRQFDARRVDDVRLIYREVMRRSAGPAWANPAVPLAQVAPLPASLDDIARGAQSLRPRIVDPETRQQYEYHVTGPAHFRLCAVFGQPRDEIRDVAWNHGSGRYCYEFDALNPIR
jgi:Domain of unknown function (DUF5671)